VQKAINEINKAASVALFTHHDPDGDAIGSMIAIYLALKEMGKKAEMFCIDKVPEIYKFLPESAKVADKFKPDAKFDLAIVVDCGDIDRPGKDLDIRAIAPRVLNIDHHPDNTKFGDVNYIEGISSVSEMIYKLFNSMGINLTKDIAECLYTGIMTDTGNFRYDYTTADTFEAARQMVLAGAQSSRIAMMVYETKTLPATRILGAAMYRLETSESGKVAWTVLPKKLMTSIGAKSEDLTGLVDHIRSVKGVEVAVLFREDDDGIKVNFRSKFKINVSEIAGNLGGGGHIRASGAILQGSLDEVKEKVLAEVFKVIK
jgi:phosphoesterase RecJ-like protein